MGNTTIGIDIGSAAAKVVCLRKDEGVYSLTGYGILNHQGDTALIKQFIQGSGLPSGEVRLNIEDVSMKIRRVDLPPVADEEIPESVKWSLKDIVKGDVDDYSFRHIMISKDDYFAEGKLPVVAFAINKKAVEERMQFAKEAGIKKPSVVEPDIMAIASLFYCDPKKEHESDTVIVNIGNKMVIFSAMGRRGMLFSRPMDCCNLSDFAKEIAKELVITEEHVTDVLTRYMKGEGLGLTEEKDAKMKAVIQKCFSKIAIETQRSMDSYSLMFQGRKVSKIYISGGGAVIRGMVEYLEHTLAIKAFVLDPFEGINTSLYSTEQLQRIRPLFAVATGLAVD